jgi:ABC-type phosphate transport system substrate-binding protein
MKKILILSLLMLMAVALGSFTERPVAAGDFVIIVNSENPIAALSAGEAKLYFLRKLKNRWPGINKNIRPVSRKSKCGERDAFYSSILKMNDVEVDNYFAERQFQNAEKPPEKFANDAEVISYVEQEIGGIGFVSAKSLTPANKAKVKAVLDF